MPTPALLAPMQLLRDKSDIPSNFCLKVRNVAFVGQLVAGYRWCLLSLPQLDEAVRVVPPSAA